MPTKRAAPFHRLLMLIVVLSCLGCAVAYLRACKDYDQHLGRFTTSADYNR